MELIEMILTQDAVYQRDIADAAKIKTMIEQIELSDNDIAIIDDYIACLNSASERKCEVALKLGRLLGELSKDNIF